MQRIVDNVEAHVSEVWGSQTVKLTHSLVGSDLFSDGSLASLIDSVDPPMLGIKTMGDHCENPTSWYRCSREGVAGIEVLEAARHGRIWINISAVHEADSRFAEILDTLYGELETHLPQFRTSKRRLGLLISSPGAHVLYHADPLGQGLLQVRGHKRVWIYPATPPFLEPREIENIVRGVTEEELSYQPWFDNYAEIHDLEPGEMLHWTLNAPHRVGNHDSMNVSLTTEHWTKEIRRFYAMNYGNGLLRSLFGATPRSRALTGAAFWAKAGLTVAGRALAGHDRQVRPGARYHVDPSSPSGARPIADAP